MKIRATHDRARDVRIDYPVEGKLSGDRAGDADAAGVAEDDDHHPEPER
jgi:hypothetical protein